MPDEINQSEDNIYDIDQSEESIYNIDQSEESIYIIDQSGLMKLVYFYSTSCRHWKEFLLHLWLEKLKDKLIMSPITARDRSTDCHWKCLQ